MATYKKKDEELEGILSGVEDKDYSDQATAYTQAADYYAQKYMNRDDFSFDYNSDELYNMYKKQYQQNAQKSMQDTLGQAAALTGGYNSSYAQTAAQQAYDNTMQGLNVRIPELYQLALDRYNTEQERTLEKGNYYASLAQNALANTEEYQEQVAQNLIANAVANYDGDLNKDSQKWFETANKSADPLMAFKSLAASNGMSDEDGSVTALYNKLVKDEAADYGKQKKSWKGDATYTGNYWYQKWRSGSDTSELLDNLHRDSLGTLANGRPERYNYSRAEYNAMNVLIDSRLVNAGKEFANQTINDEEFYKKILSVIDNRNYTADQEKAVIAAIDTILQNPNFKDVYKNYLNK